MPTRDEKDTRPLVHPTCGRCVDLYNRRRPHSALSYRTRAAYAANLHATCDRLRNRDQLRRSHVAPPASNGVNPPETLTASDESSGAGHRLWSNASIGCGDLIRCLPPSFLRSRMHGTPVSWKVTDYIRQPARRGSKQARHIVESLGGPEFLDFSCLRGRPRRWKTRGHSYATPWPSIVELRA